MDLLNFLLLLLLDSFSISFATQGRTDVSDQKSRHKSAPSSLFARNTYSEVFIKDVVKGATVWKEYRTSLSNKKPGRHGKVQLKLDAVHTGVGWKMEKGKEVLIPVVNKEGWRYWKVSDLTMSLDLETVFDEVLPDLKNFHFHEMHANGWEEAFHRANAAFDCDNATIINRLGITSFPERGARLKYRWSDIIWNIVNLPTKDVPRIATTAARGDDLAQFNFKKGQRTYWRPTALKTPINEKSCEAAKKDCDFYAVAHTPCAIGGVHLTWDIPPI